MSIIRTHKNRWKTVPMGVFEHPDLSHYSRSILGWLLTRPDNWTVCINAMLRMTDLSEYIWLKTVRVELIKSGYLFTSKKRENGRITWSFDVYSEPMPLSTAPHQNPSGMVDSEVEETTPHQNPSGMVDSEVEETTPYPNPSGIMDSEVEETMPYQNLSGMVASGMVESGTKYSTNKEKELSTKDLKEYIPPPQNLKITQKQKQRHYLPKNFQISDETRRIAMKRLYRSSEIDDQLKLFTSQKFLSDWDKEFLLHLSFKLGKRCRGMSMYY